MNVLHTNIFLKYSPKSALSEQDCIDDLLMDKVGVDIDYYKSDRYTAKYSYNDILIKI